MRHEQHSTHVKQDQTARPTGETLRGSSMVHSDGTRGLGGERAVRRPKTVLSASGIAFAYRVHDLGSMQCYNRPFGSPTMCASSLVPYGGIFCIIFCMPQRAWRGKTHYPSCYVPVYDELRGVRIGQTGGLDAKITSENAAGVALLDRNRHGL